MDLSIIVPVYNSGAYLRRTVGLLQTQEAVEFEIILVDDGSTDESPRICDEIAAKADNVRVIHIQNSGPGHARNEGIRIAQGKYLAFCDSDDCPGQNMYGQLLSILEEKAVDHVICDIYSERDHKAFGFPWRRGDTLFSGDGVVSGLMASMLGNPSDNDMSQPVWGSSVRGIYVKDIVMRHGVLFPEDIRFAEDLVFNIRYLKNIRSCYVVDKALYRYTLNQESLMNSHVRYNVNTFPERVRLVEYIEAELDGLAPCDELRSRFLTSQRCYFIESVGNAARAIKSEGYRYAYNEIRAIVRHACVRRAFARYDAKSAKRRLSYGLVRNGCAWLLLLYYAVRLR